MTLRRVSIRAFALVVLCTAIDDVALVRNGGIEGTLSFALGGRTFTRRLASEQGIDLDEAEALKLKYARRELTTAVARDVRKALDAADRFGYEVRFLPVGPEDPAAGAPTQMGVFTRCG